jgi:NAD(P)-dependent dehydrogenase (short-subunit alcohol dehydrogenase family)
MMPDHPNLAVLPLDVTDAGSIAAAVAAAGPVDVLVNNAGFGGLAAVEGMDMGQLRAMFETNTFGTFAMTKAVLPQMRARGAGVVVNVTSSVTLLTVPLLSVYKASKAAVNAFGECLAEEVAPFGIRVVTVLPGRAPGTRFGEASRARMTGAEIPEAYGAMAQALFANLTGPGPVTEAEDVAEAVWRAATDPAAPLRIAAGADAVALMG